MAEQDIRDREPPLDGFASVGVRLRRAREVAGLSRSDVAARTKIAERHLAAIEEDRFDDLASSTYAVGFSRAYARAVGLEEREIAQSVRDQIESVDGAGERTLPSFEPGDPARVPSSRIAWIAAAAALALVVAVFVLWRSYYAPAVSLPDLTSEPVPAAPPVQASLPSASPVNTAGAVVVTARQPGIWIKVSDAAGMQLFQKELAMGESYTVPAGAADPVLRTARPDALAITIGGRPVPPLSDKAAVLTAPISAKALLARGGQTAAVAAPKQAPATASPSPSPSSTTAGQAPAHRAEPSPSTSASPAAATAVPSPPASPTAATPEPPAASVPAAEAPKASTVSQ